MDDGYDNSVDDTCILVIRQLFTKKYFTNIPGICTPAIKLLLFFAYLPKMHQEKYNLNWHTYSDHLREMLHEMMKSDELTDVTLVCDDKRQFKAHKIVFSA